MTEEELQQVHPLAALLRSLLPWVNLGQAPDYAADDAEQAGGGGGGGGAQQQQQGQQPPGEG